MLELREHAVSSANLLNQLARVYLATNLAPATVMPSMRSVGEATEPRNTRSLPIAVTFISISARLPAIVTSSTACVSWPFSIHRPGRAARVVAGHNVGAEAHQAGDVEARRHIAR